ncbi:MAG: hypothetical protein GYA50_00060 [Eubacteriaceae bacterium]|nr:hypothetical protein [Eubacteriaceae bacterium]
MKNKNRIFKISPSVIVCIPFFFMIDLRAAFMCGIIAFSIHETGHLIAAKLFKQKLNKAVLMPFGAVFIFEKTKCTSKAEDIILYSAGIIINFIAGIVSFFASRIFSSNIYFTYLIYYNILIAMLNLMPICSLDGSKILKNILDIVLKEDTSILMCDISVVISIILILFNAACIAGGVMIVTPFALGIFGLLNTIFDKKKIKNEVQITKNGIVSIAEDMNLADVIKQYGARQNILIRVKDKDKKTIGFFNREELMNAYNVFGYGADMRKIIAAKNEHTLQN